MKKLLLTAAIVVLVPFAVSAVSFSDAVKTNVAKGVDCNVKAASIIAEGGKEALGLYEELASGKEITADNEKLVTDLKAYVKDGCAEGHLKKAIAAVSQ